MEIKQIVTGRQVAEMRVECIDLLTEMNAGCGVG